MKKFEYKIVDVPHLGSNHEQQLNDAAQEGWRLVACMPNDETHMNSFVFEREKSD